jgi:hypothetical protein
VWKRAGLAMLCLQFWARRPVHHVHATLTGVNQNTEALMTLKIYSACFPVVRNRWLFYAWQEGAPEAQATVQQNEGSGGLAKLFKSIPGRIISTAQTQWRSLKEAKEGTFKNYAYTWASYLICIDMQKNMEKKVSLALLSSCSCHWSNIRPSSLNKIGTKLLYLEVLWLLLTYFMGPGIAIGVAGRHDAEYDCFDEYSRALSLAPLPREWCSR